MSELGLESVLVSESELELVRSLHSQCSNSLNYHRSCKRELGSSIW